MEFWAVRQLWERRTEAWWPCVYVADSVLVDIVGGEKGSGLRLFFGPLG